MSTRLPRIGILNTVISSSPEFRKRFGRYIDNFRDRLLGEEFESAIFDVVAGEGPSSIDAFDGYLISGSEASVYDERPLIPTLEAFVRSVAAQKIPLVGICFGHQIIARALGARVEKNPQGWGIGRISYRVSSPQPWMSQQKEISMLALHGDQVLSLPQDSVVMLQNDFTPFAGLAYKRAPIISVQAHPEFSAAYAEALLLELRGTYIAEELVDKALASLNKPNDSGEVISWIRGFLKNPVMKEEG